jgi:hypothetical protein
MGNPPTVPRSSLSHFFDWCRVLVDDALETRIPSCDRRAAQAPRESSVSRCAFERMHTAVRPCVRACVRAVPAALSGGKVARVGWLCQASKASNLVTTTVSTMRTAPNIPQSQQRGVRMESPLVRPHTDWLTHPVPQKTRTRTDLAKKVPSDPPAPPKSSIKNQQEYAVTDQPQHITPPPPAP